MLEHDVGVFADERADVLAEASPLGLVLGVLVLPELVAPALRSITASQPRSCSSSALSGDDTTPTGMPPPLSTYCTAYPPMPPVAPQTSTTSPCFIRAPCCTDEHAIRRRVAQRVARRLLPCEVGGLRHELVRLHEREIGETAEVRLEAPDALVGREHRVVVRGRVLVVDVVAVDGDPVAGLPVAHRGADAQHDARRVGADHVVRQVVALRPTRSPCRARSRNTNVGSGSKIDVHTVLKLIELAITAT